MTITVPTLVLVLPLMALVCWLYYALIVRPIMRYFDRWAAKKMAESFGAATEEFDPFGPDSPLMNARVKIWFCPVRHPRDPIRETVRWDGDVATCMDCGRTNRDG